MSDYETVDILLVEDSPTDAELSLRALRERNLGKKVVHVVDGDQALDFVFASNLSARWDPERAPKVILLDLNLKKVGGIAVLKQLKSEERTRPIPVVLLTSSINQSELEECYRLGVNSCVIKPSDGAGYMKVVGDIAHYWLNLNRGNFGD